MSGIFYIATGLVASLIVNVKTEITSTSLLCLHRPLGRSDFREISGVSGEMLDLIHTTDTKPFLSFRSLLIAQCDYG